MEIYSNIREHENLKFVSFRIFRFVQFHFIGLGTLKFPVNEQVKFLLVCEEKISFLLFFLIVSFNLT